MPSLADVPDPYIESEAGSFELSLRPLGKYTPGLVVPGTNVEERSSTSGVMTWIEVFSAR